VHLLHRGKIHKNLRGWGWEEDAENMDRRYCKCTTGGIKMTARGKNRWYNEDRKKEFRVGAGTRESRCRP